jgi:GGDEF domain-containing protein
VESGKEFWAAFIEVDRFKSINDEFSYEDADKLLQHIGDRLRIAASDYFSTVVVPIRAHGDEFFLVGQGIFLTPEEMQIAFRGLCDEISRIRIGVVNKDRPMSCTVSIGWLLSTDAVKAKDGLTPRNVRRYLESAVAVAKIDRNSAVRFTSDMQKSEMRTDRADCRDCGTKFSISIPMKDEKDGDLSCPNCQGAVARTQALRKGSAKEA